MKANSRLTHSGPEAAGPRAAQGLIVFRLANQRYALPRSAVREILPLPRLARPLGAPAALAGFLNLGGRLVAVVRLGRLFGLLDASEDLSAPVLLLSEAGGAVALLVDEVEHVLSGRSEILPIGERESFNACAVGVLRTDDRMVVVLDARRILLERERQALIDFQALAERRQIEWEVAAP